MGHLLLENGEFEEALFYFKQAIRKAPELYGPYSGIEDLLF
jgi:tetratricopeptide (TPR) repeat protein